MASIQKRENGYQAQVRRRGYPQVSRLFASKRDAEAWSRQIESEMDRGLYLDRTNADRTTVGELLQRYKAEVTPRKKSADAEAIRIDRFLKSDSLCAYRCSALTGKLFADWRDQRLQSVSGSTVNRELNLLSHVFNVANREWEVHFTNPIGYIQRPKHNRGRERRLTASERLVLLSTIDKTSRNPWLKPVVQFALETAMRRGEILSLAWANVDLERRVVRLMDSKNGEGRSVPLSVAATSVLSALPISIDGKVFPVTVDSLKRAFERAVKRAKIDDLHFHDLRHEAVSRLFEKGLNVMEVASISGHKTLQMLKRYTHLSLDGLVSKIG